MGELIKPRRLEPAQLSTGCVNRPPPHGTCLAVYADDALCSDALMLLKVWVNVSDPWGGRGGGWARADPPLRRTRGSRVLACRPGSRSPSAGAPGTAQLTPLPSSAPRSSRGPGRTTCSSGTGGRSPRRHSCWRTCEPPCRWVPAAPAPTSPRPPRAQHRARPQRAPGHAGHEVSVAELPRPVGRTASRDT